MRKIYLLLALLCLTIHNPIRAYDFEADGYYFNITDATNHEVEVTYKDTNYKSYSGVIDIPSTVSNDNVSYTVTAIGAHAFRDCGTLPSVKIPNTVKIIGDYAFYGCANIYSLTVGSNVQTIGTGAFYDYYNSSNDSRNSLIPIKKAIWLCNTLPSGVSYSYNNSTKYHMSVSKNYVSNDQLKLSNQEVYPFLSSKFEVDNVVYVPVSPSDRTCDVIDCN